MKRFKGIVYIAITLALLVIAIPSSVHGAFFISTTLSGNDHFDPTTLGNNSYTTASKTVTVPANSTLAASRVVYMTSTGKVLYTNATDNLTCDPYGLTVQSITGQAKGTILLNGYWREDGWAFTAGNRLWLDADNSGNVTDVQPSDSGDQDVCIGRAISEDIGYFHFDATWVGID